MKLTVQDIQDIINLINRANISGAEAEGVTDLKYKLMALLKPQDKSEEKKTKGK